jgi:hypothetical protein
VSPIYDSALFLLAQLSDTQNTFPVTFFAGTAMLPI